MLLWCFCLFFVRPAGPGLQEHTMHTLLRSYHWRWTLLTVAVVFGSLGCGGSGSPAAPPVSPPSNPPVTPPVTELPPLPEVVVAAQLGYLQSFVRLAAVVRYHYPGDAADATNWDALLTESVYRIAQAPTAAAAEQVIWQQLSPLVPELTLNNRRGQRPALSSDSQVRVWRQSGYQQVPGSAGSYLRERLDLRLTALSQQPELPQQQVYRYSDALIEAEVPLVALLQNGQTQPVGQAFSRSASHSLPGGMDHVAACVSAVGQLWAVFEHFFPYFHQLDLNWSAELGPMLQSCDQPDRSLTLRQLYRSLTLLQDNHIRLGSAYTGALLGYSLTPVRFDWIEGKLRAVYRTSAYQAGGHASDSVIALGDELLQVNGQPALALMQELSAISMRSEHRRRHWAAHFLLLRGQAQQAFQLRLRRPNGTEYQTTLLASEPLDMLQQVQEQRFQPQGSQFAWLTPELAYVNLARTESADMAQTISELQKARAIVLDLRAYPTLASWFELLPRLTSRPVASLPMYHRFVSHPDYSQRYRRQIQQQLQPQTPWLHVPVVALSSRYSVSRNEHLLGYIQSIGIPVLGEDTFGINGEVTLFEIAGGAQARGLTGYFTGMEVNQHDGSRLAGRGIVPDIPQPVTLAALQSGEDVQLVAAQRYLQQQLAKR